MTAKQLNKAFKKMLHPDLKDEIEFSIEDWNNDRESGWVIFLDADFEELFRCSPKMYQALQWYLTNPKVKHSQAKNSDSGYDRALSLLDANTGSRHIEDYSDDKDELVQMFYQLRKKFCTRHK